MTDIFKKLKKDSLPRSRKAFSLIETLIAIFILEIGILGVAAYYSSSFKTTRVARNETIASNLASGLLDQELSNSYDDITVGTGAKARYSTDPQSPFYNWYDEIDVSYVDSNLNVQPTDTNMKKIVVTVYWIDGVTPKSFQIASIKSKQ